MRLWDDYHGWDSFEQEHVLPTWMSVVDNGLPSGGRLLSVGCGPGYPECLFRERATVYGIDTNDVQIARANGNGIRARFCDAFDLGESPELVDMDVVTATFFVHNTPREKMRELYTQLASPLKEGGTLVTVDPHARHDFKRARGNNYRIACDVDSTSIRKAIDPDRDQYWVEIHLDTPGSNAILYEHRPLAEYESVLSHTGFGNVRIHDVGLQEDLAGREFPAYMIMVAEKLAPPRSVAER